MTQGKYLMKSTLWLARQLREGAKGKRLRERWLARHRRETGYPLADPGRSYLAAVESAERWNERRGR